MDVVLYLALLFVMGFVVYKKRILDFSGTVAAVFIGGVIFFAAGYNWFILLLVFLMLGAFSTWYGYPYKQEKGVAEEHLGRRGVKNVLANSIIPASIAVFYYFTTVHPPLVAAYIAGIATVAGDTLSSEIGVLSKKRPILITTLEKVPTGTHGGISLLGEAAGVLATVIIGLFAWKLGLADFGASLVASMVGGTAGFHFDSFLGAVFERKKIIGNATVNFLSTVAGSLVGFIIGIK